MIKSIFLYFTYRLFLINLILISTILSASKWVYQADLLTSSIKDSYEIKELLGNGPLGSEYI